MGGRRVGPFSRVFSGWLLITSVLVAGFSAAISADDLVPPNAGTVVGVASSTLNVRPDASVSLSSGANLSAARNEFESFQVVIQADATPQTGVTVSTDPAHPLTGTAGTIANANITIYRADYFDAVQQSDSEGGTGRWADPLIPSVDYIYGEQRDAFPLDVPAGENRVAWVDVLVPANQPPGTYTGSLLVTGDGLNESIPVELEVLDFTMPSTPTLKNSFLTNYHQVCDAHTANPYCNWDDEQRWALHSLYARVALENRVTISNPWPLGHNQAPPTAGAYRDYWEQYALPLIQGNPVVDSGGLWSAPRLQGAALSSVVFYAYASGHCFAAGCVDGWETEANTYGFADKVYAYACDEPGVTQASWDNCATYADQAMAAWPQVDTLVTATINDAQNYGDTSKISILVPPVNRLDDKVGSYVGNQRPNYDTYLQDPDNSLWSYNSCLSNGCWPDPPDPDSNSDYWDGWPSYAIDAPASQQRAMGFMAYLYDFTGELFWETTYRLDQAWNNCQLLGPNDPDNSNCLFYEGTNGDGTLFYPGLGDANSACDANPGRACIGGTHDIPLESIRLKRIRDGREDFELLTHLESLGQGAAAKTIVESLFPNMHSVTPDRDGAPFDTARDELIDLLPTPTGTPAITFTSNRDGNNEIYVMNADGTGQTRLTNNPAADGKPSWSPDGSKIAFMSNRDGNNEIYVMNADGTGQTRLTNNPAADEKPAWSPDGTTIAFVSNRNGNDDVFVMAVDGSSQTALTTDPAGDYDQAWSPDGSTLVFTSTRGGTPDLYTMSSTGASQQPLTGGIDGEDDLADWSNDGSLIAIDRVYGTFGTDYEIWRMNADGSNPVALTTDPAHDYAPSFSTDDSQIAFVSTRDGDAEIMVMNVDGTAQTALTANAAVEADPDWLPADRNAARGDFDGDGDSDVTVFRPAGSGWFVQGGLSTSWGASGDVPFTGDFNGDRTAEVAVYRPSDQTWYVQPSSSFPAGLATQWGVPGDIPIPADFNGDGITDLAVFRPSDQTWYAQPSSSFPTGLATQWGVPGDIPTPADFDGDGADEVAVYRPSDQTWYSQAGLATQWGVTGDIPVPADFDGDGTDEVAVYRPSDQTWYSQAGLATQWGIPGDKAVPGDYNGDGADEVAVFRPSNQTWYSQAGLATQWGATGDIPVIVPPALRNL